MTLVAAMPALSLLPLPLLSVSVSVSVSVRVEHGEMFYNRLTKPL